MERCLCSFQEAVERKNSAVTWILLFSLAEIVCKLKPASFIRLLSDSTIDIPSYFSFLPKFLAYFLVNEIYTECFILNKVSCVNLINQTICMNLTWQIFIIVVACWQETLGHLSKFVRGSVAEQSGCVDELVKSALQLLQSLPATRSAVLQYIADIYDDAVNKHLEQRTQAFSAY